MQGSVTVRASGLFVVRRVLTDVMEHLHWGVRPEVQGLGFGYGKWGYGNWGLGLGV